MEKNNVKIGGGGQYGENDCPYEFDITNDDVAVFLSTDLINRFDEYSNSDPYQVEQEIQSEFHQRRIKCTIELVRKVTNGMSRVQLLDIGCGEGHITAGIKKEFPHFDIIGTDASITACRNGKKKYPEVKFMVADAYHLPCPDEYFDIIVLNNIWEHVPDPLRLLSGVRRILRENGKVVISTPSRYRFSNIINLIKRGKTELVSKNHVTEYTIGQVIEQLRFGGFEIIDIMSSSIPVRTWLGNIIKNIFRFIYNKFDRQYALETTVFFSARKV